MNGSTKVATPHLRMKREGVRLLPGESYASQSGLVLSTLLGSCVSACLYDPINRVAGMNHFLLSNTHYSKGLRFTHSDVSKRSTPVSSQRLEAQQTEELDLAYF